jgi:hypothetical protein
MLCCSKSCLMALTYGQETYAQNPEVSVEKF